MNHRSNFDGLRVVVSLTVIAVFAASEHGCDRIAVTLDDSRKEVVAYRLSTWKSMHFEDPVVAAEHMTAVRKLGCEAWQEDHGGHIDIVYRCLQWMRVLIASHEMAKQKLDWLEAAGFDTHHSHLDEAFLQGEEAVEIRLDEWRTLHLEGVNSGKADEMLKTLRGVSAAVQSESHQGHLDIKFRCPGPTTLRVADRESADKLHDLLSEYGFDVRRTR